MVTDQENFLIVKKLLEREKGPCWLTGLLKKKQDFFKSSSGSYILFTETTFNVFNISVHSGFDYVAGGQELYKLHETT